MEDEIEVLRRLREFCRENKVTIYSHDSMFEGGQGSIVLVVKSTPFRAAYFSSNITQVTVDNTVAIGAIEQPNRE
ncbi:MAG: hypothetical protein E6Q97_21595 [Desulfurellales bacterium]|nr:MAG: hypothetical protein E6Q97_21595 [Desulfurellales bacterium]